jgi:hypothetical protein
VVIGTHFLDPARRNAWRRWKFDWQTPKQPDEHDWNYGSYVISHLLPIEVMVEDRIPLNDEALWEPI